MKAILAAIVVCLASALDVSAQFAQWTGTGGSSIVHYPDVPALVVNSGSTSGSSSVNFRTGSNTDQWIIGFGVFRHPSLDLSLGTGSAEKFTIQQGGNVGIGATAPVSALEVSRGTDTTVTISGDGGLGTAFLNFAADGSLAKSQVGGGKYGPTGGFLQFGTLTNGALTEKVRIDTDGKVGIGLINPARKLHVFSAVNADGLAIDGTTNPGITFMNAGTAKGYIGLPTGPDAYFTGAGANDLIIRSESNRILIGQYNAGVPPTLTVSGPGPGIGQRLTVAGNLNKAGSWVLGDTVWPGSLEVHNANWDGSSNANYGGIFAGHGYYYYGLQSGGGSGAEAGQGQLYVQGTSMLNGSVGIGLGTSSPAAKLQVAGSSLLNGIYAGYNDAVSLGNGDNGQQIHFGGVSTVDLILEAYAPFGKVGIGMSSPTTLLTVGASNTPSSTTTVTANGSLNVTGNINAGGTVKSTFQDVAEWVPSSEQMLPGTVVIVSESDNVVAPSTTAYDTRVAGVVSAAPGVLLGVESSTKSKIATTGRVKVRVDATKVAIHRGDLLVTSDKPGVAMKSEPLDLGGVKLHRPGTLIGKALQPLPSGQGEILVLLSLQ